MFTHSIFFNARMVVFFIQVVYFTATFPYVMLLILLIRGLSLPGALQGVVFYLLPEPSRLLDTQVRTMGFDPGSIWLRWTNDKCTHCCFIGTGLDGGWGTDLFLLQCGRWLFNGARELQPLQQQLL